MPEEPGIQPATKPGSGSRSGSPRDIDATEQRVAERVERVRARRVRHRDRSLLVRGATVVAGSLLGLLALPLVVLLPELGVPLMLGALSLLALEFEWAIRALAWVIRTWSRIVGWYRGLGRVGKTLVWVVLVGVLVVIVQVTLAHA